MPRVYLFSRSNFQDLKVLYLTDQAVGAGCPNLPEDVALVQFFLRVAMENSAASKGYRPPGEAPINVDGRCGPQTIRYIRYFLEESNRRYPHEPLKVDSRVDPIRSGTVASSISQTTYTIFALNVCYKTRRGDRHIDIRQDPLFPQMLAKSFYID
jgi:hypothetical protein